MAQVGHYLSLSPPHQAVGLEEHEPFPGVAACMPFPKPRRYEHSYKYRLPWQSSGPTEGIARFSYWALTQNAFRSFADPLYRAGLSPAGLRLVADFACYPDMNIIGVSWPQC
jgi:hypothetical protein